MIKVIKLLLNPFNRIAGMPALLLGLVFMAVSLWLMQHFGVHSGGSFHTTPISKNFQLERFPLWLYMISLGFSFLFPVLMFFVVGKIFSKSKIRLLDIAGTVAFAHVALMFSVICNSFEAASNYFNGEGIQYSYGVWLWRLSFLFSAWFFVLLVNALKVSCNIRGLKLAFSAIVFFILSQFVVPRLNYYCVMTLGKLVMTDDNSYIGERNNYDLSIVGEDTSVLLSGVWKGTVKLTPFDDTDAYLDFEFDEKWRIKSAVFRVPSKNIKERFDSVVVEGKWNAESPVTLKSEECMIDITVTKLNEMRCFVLFRDSSSIFIKMNKIPYESDEAAKVRDIIRSENSTPVPIDEQLVVKGRYDEFSAEYVAYRCNESGWEKVDMFGAKSLAAVGGKIWRLRVNNKYGINSMWHKFNTRGDRGINYFAPHMVYLDVLTEDLVYEKTFEFPMDVGHGGEAFGFTALDDNTLAFVFNRTADHVGGNESKIYLFDIPSETLKELPYKMKKTGETLHLIAPAPDGNFYVTANIYDRVHNKNKWVQKRAIFLRLVDREGNLLKEYSELREFDDAISIPEFKIVALHALKDGRAAFVVDESVPAPSKRWISKEKYLGSLRVLDREMEKSSEIEKFDGVIFNFTEIDGGNILLTAVDYTDKDPNKEELIANKIEHVALAEYDSTLSSVKNRGGFKRDGNQTSKYFSFVASSELLLLMNGSENSYSLVDLNGNVKGSYISQWPKGMDNWTGFSLMMGNLFDAISLNGKIYFAGTYGEGRFGWHYLMKTDFKDILKKIGEEERKGANP